MQRRDVLLERVVLDVLNRLLRERSANHVGRSGRFGQLEDEVGLRVAHQVVRARTFLFGRKADFDVVADTIDARVANALVAELRAQVGSGRFCALGNCSTHINLQQEVNAAAKVKAEIHRLTVERQEPIGGIGRQVERCNVARILRIGIECAVDDFACFELLFGLRWVKANADRVLLSPLLEEDAVGGEVRIGERLLNLFEGLLRDFRSRLGGRNLYRGRFPVKIRQRVDHPDKEHDADQNVLPKRIAIHRSLRFQTSEKRAIKPFFPGCFGRTRASKSVVEAFRSPVGRISEGRDARPVGHFASLYSSSDQNLMEPFGRTI